MLDVSNPETKVLSIITPPEYSDCQLSRLAEAVRDMGIRVLILPHGHEVEVSIASHHPGNVVVK